MKILTFALMPSLFLISACASNASNSSAQSISFEQLNNLCKVGGSLEGCSELSQQRISIIGVVQTDSDFENVMVSPTSSLNTENTDEWLVWNESIQIMGTRRFRESIEVHVGKTVKLTGALHTGCVEVADKSYRRTQDGEFPLFKSGTCHYVNNRAFFDADIEVILD